jgi:class 3 adenylate cyclase
VSAAATPANSAAPSGDRRQVTALFADMAGFTAISERLGEEGTFALIQPIYELMAGAVREHGGSVKDFTGDGIMALFGVPDALEDAPLRACRAGLAIQERLAAAAPAIEAKHGVRPQMRIGVNSGLAVVTRIRSESGSVTALGDTVNLASRLQTLAEPGTVYLSEATQRLVQGLVETTFAGEHTIKGKATPQRVYRLDAIRHGAARFDAAVGRGLTAYVGREREMDALQRTLADARRELRLIDVVAEPGMGKSRLLYEFRQRVGKEQAFVLSGSCSPDGQQTAFLPFIEVVRGSFQVKGGEAEAEITRKLSLGLSAMGLQSAENVGLLLNLLGLKPPEDAFAGLDGLLIGLRTRNLLQSMLAERCRHTPVVLLIEDLHWIDGASQEVLGKIVANEANLGLLILHTRRPEYEPPWRDRPVSTTLRLPPLPAGDIRRLAEARLGVEALPETLTQQLAARAEGNALFAEEILSFLTERGVLRVVAGKVEFDAGAVAAAMPASVQSILTARVDRLAPRDRALLQAAAVVGRRFDSQLLAAVADEPGGIEDRLGAMQALDLVHPEGTGDFAFKHALVRDALYQGLLTGPRRALHLKIAEEIERRSRNRLSEVVEALAHHYGQTDHVEKAFTYLAQAGAKSLGVYSLDDAGAYLEAALTVLDKNPDCAADEQVASFLADYSLCSNASLRVVSTTKCIERFALRLSRAGDSHIGLVVQHHYVLALLWSGRYMDAIQAQEGVSTMASKLGDLRSKAYELVSGIHVSTIVVPYPTAIFDALSREVIMAASKVNDAYLQIMAHNFVGWEEFHRGRITKATEAAEELMAVGRRLNDRRSIGLAMQLQAWKALTSDDYEGALSFAEIGMREACAPFDREAAKSAYVAALVFLRRPEALQSLQTFMEQCANNSWAYLFAGADGPYAVALAMRGEIGAAIRWLDEAISRREHEGQRTTADWYRMFLCEIYLEVISGKERPTAQVILRNARTLASIIFGVQSRVSSLVEHIRQNPQFDPNGHHIGRCEMILGLLYKTKKKRTLALRHLIEAKRIISQFGPTPMLARIEAALAELG